MKVHLPRPRSVKALLAVVLLTISQHGSSGEASPATALGFKGKPVGLPALRAHALRGKPVALMPRDDGGLVAVSEDGIAALPAGARGWTAYDGFHPSHPSWPQDLESEKLRVEWSAAALQNQSVVAVALLRYENYMRWEAREMLIARYDGQGRHDTRFGRAGVVRLPLAESKERLLIPATLAVQADGKVLVAGWAMVDDKDPARVFVLRLGADGMRDKTFGKDGVALLGQGEVSSQTLPVGLHVQADGKMLLMATGRSDGVPTPWLRRLDATGQVDRTYGTDGRFVLEGLDDRAFIPSRLIFSPRDHSYLLGGMIGDNGTEPRHCVLVKLDGEGKPQTGFGDRGTLVFSPASAQGCAVTDARPTADGGLLVGGYLSYDKPQLDFYRFFFVQRFLAAGAPPEKKGSRPQFVAGSSSFAGAPSFRGHLAPYGSGVAAFFDCESRLVDHASSCPGGSRLSVLK
ncbi:hypothetical protein OOT46_01615 [Aquabacterium sp. A7-Y]|uniref:hypothetical protein n=1 Tax=Aquabacterium sp. A7-Y TaxID=1349605 RepID=UPI00223E2724|nr:hypothetical protein [Aquabacterium sp. A7-Y]MCW7536554.1 hypothetical protein [Aquabacterium sp. A7-Y]